MVPISFDNHNFTTFPAIGGAKAYSIDFHDAPGIAGTNSPVSFLNAPAIDGVTSIFKMPLLYTGTSIFHQFPRFSWVLFSNYSHFFWNHGSKNFSYLLFVYCYHFCVHFYPFFHNISIVLFDTKNTKLLIFISNIIKKHNLYIKNIQLNMYAIFI